MKNKKDVLAEMLAEDQAAYERQKAEAQVFRRREQAGHETRVKMGYKAYEQSLVVRPGRAA